MPFRHYKTNYLRVILSQNKQVSYTFGGATSDDITWSLGPSVGATATAVFVCGWWRPTTLTATRGLWSCGNTFGAEIDATTDELRLRTDNTTDGQWTTAGVDLVANEWRYIAFANTCLNGTPSAAWRVWAGGISSAPIECTVTVATSPSGNFTGNANFYIGNKGTGTLAFQGQISDVLVCSGSTPSFAIAAHGAISNDEAGGIYRRLVWPTWLGIHDLNITKGANPTATLGQGIDYFSGLYNGIVRRTQQGTGIQQGFVAPTINGATLSEENGPRPYIYSINHPSFLRR